MYHIPLDAIKKMKNEKVDELLLDPQVTDKKGIFEYDASNCQMLVKRITVLKVINSFLHTASEITRRRIMDKKKILNKDSEDKILFEVDEELADVMKKVFDAYFNDEEESLNKEDQGKALKKEEAIEEEPTSSDFRYIV